MAAGNCKAVLGRVWQAGPCSLKTAAGTKWDMSSELPETHEGRLRLVTEKEVTRASMAMILSVCSAWTEVLHGVTGQNA